MERCLLSDSAMPVEKEIYFTLLLFPLQEHRDMQDCWESSSQEPSQIQIIGGKKNN